MPVKILVLISFIAPKISFAYSPLVPQVQSTANQLSGGASAGNDLSALLNQWVYLIIGVAVVLAIFMIIRGGYGYMTSSDNANKKTEAKNRIKAAFGGLLLALGAVLILQTINPNITNFNLFSGDNPLSSPNRPAAPPANENTPQQNSQNPNTFLTDGFQQSDSFLSGENQEFADQILNMSDDDLTNLINQQLGSEEGRNDYREFLLELIEDRDFYQNGQHTNSPDIRNEIERMNNLLSRFSQIDSSIDSEGIYQQAAVITTSRRMVGLIDERGQTISGGGAIIQTSDFTDPSRFTSYTLLFATNDNEGIRQIYNSSGGNNENNGFSNTLVEVLNNPEQYPQYSSQISVIQNWVDENGNSVGVVGSDDGYTTSN